MGITEPEAVSLLSPGGLFPRRHKQDENKDNINIIGFRGFAVVDNEQVLV